MWLWLSRHSAVRRLASHGEGSIYCCGRNRSGRSSGWRLADARQYSLGRLEIGQLSGDFFTGRHRGEHFAKTGQTRGTWRMRTRCFLC
jgi:hypothetical protein